MSDTAIDRLEMGELELDILRLCISDRSFVTKMVSSLEAESLESSIHRNTFKIIKTLFETHNQIPSEKMVKSVLLKKGMEEKLVTSVIGKVFDEDKISQLDRDFILGEVETFAKRKKMKDAIVNSFDLLKDNKFGEINELVQDALKFNLDTDLGFDLFDVDARYQAMMDENQNKISSGYPNLDKILNGGWSKKELHCVMGPPGMGKSIFLCNWGYNAMVKGHNVAHYSFEMSEARVSLRYDAIATKIHQTKLKENRAKIREKYNMLQKGLTKARVKIKEFPTGGASVADIKAHLEQLRTIHNFVPDVVIVDYGDIMRSSKKTNNTYEEQGWIFRELRGLAIEMNVAVITGTQARRDALNQEGGTKENVGMDQIADSMEKTRILDVLFSIVQSKIELANRQMKLTTIKNRNGDNNKFTQFYINYGTMTLSDQSPPQVAIDKDPDPDDE